MRPSTMSTAKDVQLNASDEDVNLLSVVPA